MILSTIWISLADVNTLAYCGVLKLRELLETIIMIQSAAKTIIRIVKFNDYPTDVSIRYIN